MFMDHCLSFSIWPLYRTSFLRLQIISLVSSNFSLCVIRSICPFRLAYVLLAGDNKPFSLRCFCNDSSIGRFSNRSCADGSTYIYAIFIILINQLSDVFGFFPIVLEQQYFFLKIFQKVLKKKLKISIIK